MKNFLWSRVILTIFLICLGSLSSHAELDANSNGVSDVWERAFNGGALYSSFDSAADLDGDGWTNAQEATAGTDPIVSKPPAGMVQTLITRHPDVTGVFTIRWKPALGKLSRIYVSADPGLWELFETIPATGEEIQLAIDASLQEGGRPDKLFWRVMLSDTASTTSGLSDYEMEMLGMTPGFADADTNGLRDAWEAAHAGTFAVYPPVLAAQLTRNQSAAGNAVLSNSTHSPVSYTVTLSDNSGSSYGFVDSLTGSLPYSWEEISTTGTLLSTISNADDAFEPVPISGFTFPFYGQAFSQVYANSNGLLTFGAGTSSFSNADLPNSNSPPNLIAAAWDDLDTRTTGEIYYKQETDRLIVQYQDVERLGGSGTYTFQVILFSNGRIQLRYKTLTGDTNSCTVGTQDSANVLALQILHNAAYLVSGMAIEIRPQSEFFALSPMSGSVPANSIQSLAGLFQARTLAPAVYYANMTLTHDGPGTKPLQIPVRLEIKNLPSTVELTSPALGLTILEGNTVNVSVTASDPEGILRVEFYDGPTQIGETIGNYAFHSIGTYEPAPGNRSLVARVVDAYGATTDSSPATLVVKADTDRDRIPNDWELANGLNPNNPADTGTDADLDGYTNLEEYQFGRNPNIVENSDSDPMPDGWEYHNGLNLTVNDATEDLDGDELTNFHEFQNGTIANRSDSDGDRLPDGWEVNYGLDPLNAIGGNGANGDIDPDGLNNPGDGVNNLNEYLNGTDPTTQDSDGDETSDLIEITQGSDPNDPDDGGTPPEDPMEDVVFYLGGDYASWRMEIKGMGPKDRRTLSVVSPKYNEWETKTHKLRANNRYEITLHHTGSRPQDDPPWYCWEAEISNETTTGSNPGGFFMFAGHWLVDNREGLLAGHTHSQGVNLMEGKKAFLLPVETVVGEPGTAAETPGDFLTASATPAPFVEAAVTSATLQGETLSVRLQGTVRDAVSRFAQNAGERPQTLNFYHQDELIHSIAIDDTVGDGFTFDETVEITGTKPMTYVIRAETTANIAGAKGYDESAVSLTWEEDSSAFPSLSAPLSIATSTPPGGGAVDQATVFVGNGMPQAGDTPLAGSAADSWTFDGNLQIPATPAALTAPCNLKFFSPPNLSVTQADSIVVNLQYSAPGFAKNSHNGRWEETGPNTLVFRPSGWVFGNRVLKVSWTSDLEGSAPSSFEPVTLRFPSLPDSYADEDLQIVSGGVAYDMVKEGSAWYPEDPDEAGEVKLFLPSATPVPTRLSADGYDESEGELKFSIRFPDISDLDAPEILVVPGAEESIEPPAMQGVPAPPQQLQGSPPQNGPNAAAIPPWQPGGDLLKEHVIWAYKFLNADDTFATELLDGYLRGGHQIEIGLIFGELDLDVQLNDLSTDADNIWTIQLEEEVNPVYAARLLFEGLKQASVHKEVYDHYEFSDPFDEILAFKAAMAAAVQKTQETAIAATELYLSGLGIVNEGLDWIIVINEVSEGHYESLAAALPFVSAGLIKSGGFLKLRKLSGTVTDSLDGAAVDAMKQLYRESDLRVMGITMEEHQFSETLRKALSTNGGPIIPPLDGARGELRKAMEALGPVPKGKVTAHHDLIWSERKWFAEHGIDVNNPAFGRWVSEYDHRTWHSGIGMGPGGRFHNEWKAFKAAEDPQNPYTQMIDKLASMRAQFPVTGGHD